MPIARPPLAAAILLVATLLASAAPAGAEPGSGQDGSRNWGRWGKDDERGAANLITPERIVAAAGLIRRGAIFPLGIPIDGKGPIAPSRTPPTLTTVLSGADFEVGAVDDAFRFADDYIFMPLQGATQWDALSHAWYGDTLYNGVPQREVVSAGAGGARRLGIQNVKDSLVGRGVLIDVLADKGGALPSGYSITRADLEGALERQGTEVRPGDLVVVRTGWVPGYYELEDDVARLQYLHGPQPGLSPEVVPWIKEMDVAAMAADNIGLEALPGGMAVGLRGDRVNLHGALLKDLGVYIGEIWWLEELAADCAKDGRYEFFLAAQPLNIPGAVGSPINPVAIK